MSSISLTYIIALVGLSLSVALILTRLLRGPTNADRIIALDTILMAVIGGVAIQMAVTESQRFAPILVALSLLAFVGTVAVARFLERLDTSADAGTSPDPGETS
jgi:multicomponent Na+:H+ antiporter subunit F